MEIGDRVLRLLLDYEAAQRRHELLIKQLETLEQQQRVARVSYRRGRGSTSQMLGMSDKRDRLEEQLTDVSIIDTPAAGRGGFLSHRTVTRSNNVSCSIPAPRSPQAFSKFTGCPTATIPRFSITFAAATSLSRVTPQY